MTRSEFINFLNSNDIPYEEYTENGLDQVYVFSKREFNEKKKHPKKNADLYVPYLRVSHFDGIEWYTRENGWTCYMSIDKILKKCKELGA